MYSKIYFTIIIFNLFTFSVSSQEIKKGEVYSYARKIVDTMASESMHGRGYVNGGDSIAANYLKTEFQKIGLKSFDNDYYQRLSFAVNVFDKVSLAADGRQLIPGKDFISFYQNSSASGKYAVVYADDALVANKKQFKKFKKQKFDSKVIVVNDTGKQTPELEYLPVSPKATIFLKDKLTWGVGQKLQDAVFFDVLRTSVNTQPKTIEYFIASRTVPEHSSQNVIGYIPGSEFPDSFIVYSAHYDHLGQMGKDIYFPGANDNASGCAMLLNLAKYYSMPEHKPKCSVAFMAFCGEEVALLGSKYYTEHPLFPLKNIKFLLNMDIMGTGEEGITVVNGTVFKKEFDKLKAINTENDFIKDVKIRGKAANSDHYFFAEKGVRACFVYTMGGIKAYHDIYDRPETLPLNEFEDLLKLITKFGDYLQN